MILGSLIDLGCPSEYLESIFNALPNFTHKKQKIIQCSDRKIHGIIALNLAFSLPGDQPTQPDTCRSFRDILNLLDNASIPSAIRIRAAGIFNCLADAEGAVHEMDPLSVHFHEIGALDSILDIVGIAAAVEWFHPDAIFAWPPPVGRGITASLHGPIPLPAPATVNLLRGVTVRFIDMEGELTTPTGAAVLKFLVAGTRPPSDLIIEATGYGCGSKTFENWPNLFRSILCEVPDKLDHEIVYVLETDVDDMSPEDWDTACKSLLDAGALDANLTAKHMKKGRPGMQLQVIVQSTHLYSVQNALFIHTPTIGVRYYPVTRVILPRHTRKIQTSFGEVRIKEVILPNGSKRFKPEMDDLSHFARLTGRPITDLRREIERTRLKENGE